MTARDRLAIGAYGFGQISEGLKTASFELFVFFYYVQVLGLSGTLAGAATFLALLVDAVADPWVGALSDHTRHRFGRRHPWMYAAPIPLAVTFALLFSPPTGLGETALFLWLLTFAVASRVAITLFHVPHTALGAELSDDYRERTTIVAVRTFFGLFGSLMASVVGLGFFFAATSEQPLGQLDASAYPGYGLAAAAGMVVAIVACGLGTHHRIPSLRRAPTHGAATLLGTVQQMGEALRGPSFRALFIGLVLFFVTRGVQGALALHMGTFFWRLSTSEILQVNIALALGFVAGLPVWTVASRRLDKKPTFLTGVIVFSTGVFLPPMLALAGLFPHHASTIFVPVLLAVSFAAAFGGAAGLVTAGSMMADLADEHELRTGQRQEGLFFGALAFAGKAASGIGHQVAGLGLDVISFPLQAKPEDVPAEAVADLGFLYGPSVLVLAIVSIVVLRRYDLDANRHAEITRMLASRRADGVGLD